LEELIIKNIFATKKQLIMSQIPAVIEVEIKNSNSPPRKSAIKERLEKSLHSESAPPTIEDIELKLKKAEEFRVQQLEARLFTSNEKLTKSQQKRVQLEMEVKQQTESLSNQHYSKLEKGE
jgi:hypothetical protein